MTEQPDSKTTEQPLSVGYYEAQRLLCETRLADIKGTLTELRLKIEAFELDMMPAFGQVIRDYDEVKVADNE